MVERNARHDANLGDDHKDADNYREAMEQLKSINIQVKSPGEYVAMRLETVTLDEVRRELNALLAASQTTAAGMLKALFAGAQPYNDTVESTVRSILPLKEKLEASLRALDGDRSAIKATKREAKIAMCRYVMASYAKMALAAHVQAAKHLHNIAEEIVDSFKTYNAGDDRGKRHATPVTRAIALIESIATRVGKKGATLVTQNGEHNISNNWALFELVPRELNRVKELLNQCNHYDREIAEHTAQYSKLVRQADAEKFKAQISIIEDEKRSNVEKVLELEKILEFTELEQFRAEFTVDVIAKRLGNLHSSLISLTEICAHAAMTALFQLYKQQANIKTNKEGQSPNGQSMTREIEEYIAGMSSLIKGGEQLMRQPTAERGTLQSRGGSMPFVNTFARVFVRPIFNDHVAVGTKNEGGYEETLSPQEEFNKFTKFVDNAVAHLLHPLHSITMQFLNDVARAAGNDEFKVVCIFDAIAMELLGHVENKFSSIYFPIYMDQFIRNSQAYETLLERIEIAAGKYDHYLKWRGSKVPNNSSRCFSIGVVCDNFIEETTSALTAEIERNQEVNGKLFTAKDAAFYLAASLVLYEQVHALFKHDHFFYHLMPQYLRGAAEMFEAYTQHVKIHLAEMENEGNNEAEGTSSGVSITYATYILHDLDVILHALSTSTTQTLHIGIGPRPADARETDYGCTLIKNETAAATTTEPESSASISSSSSNSTSSGSTSSTNISGVQSNASSEAMGTANARNNAETSTRAVATSAAAERGPSVVDIHGKYDGEMVKLVLKRLEYPLQICFKRLLHAISNAKPGKTEDNTTVVNKAVMLLKELWDNAGRDSGRGTNADTARSSTSRLDAELEQLPVIERNDMQRLVTFASKSIELMYNFFASVHEQLDAVKYELEDMIIQNLFTSASCSLQFLQSMPSKFRTATKHDVTKPSNYVKYLVVPLISFKEFTAPTLTTELTCKIMTQTVARLAAEYRTQVLKLLQTVKNLNHSLLNAKNIKVKEQGANYLIADLDMIKGQLATDVNEYVNQCQNRLDIKYQHCEDLKRLHACVEEELGP